MVNLSFEKFQNPCQEYNCLSSYIIKSYVIKNIALPKTETQKTAKTLKKILK